MANKGRNSAKELASGSLAFLAAGAPLDPAISSLFASSSGPVINPSRKPCRVEPAKPTQNVQDEDEESLEEEAVNAEAGSDTSSSPLEHSEADSAISSLESDPAQSEEPEAEPEPRGRERPRKRRRDAAASDAALEDAYMQRLAAQEVREERRKRQKRSPSPSRYSHGEEELDSDIEMQSDEEDDEEHVMEVDGEGNEISASASASASASKDEDEDGKSSPVPQHVSRLPSEANPELEKASRTVFLGNVSTDAITSKSARKTLLRHLASALQDGVPAGAAAKVESLRFRSTAYAAPGKMPRKGSFARRDVLAATARSTHAYAVYSTPGAARLAAAKLNGTVVLERHLRVDLVAHPAKTEPRRCVFVGNLGFVDDESAILAARAQEEGRKVSRKRKEEGAKADVEEGLWRAFGKAGTVQSVRVVRDPKTRVGKGFAYVQFEDENPVEEALLFDGKAFPPLLPRKLRVTRAKGIKRKQAAVKAAERAGLGAAPNGRVSRDDASALGRAAKMLGRAGAAQIRRQSGRKAAARGARPQRRDSRGAGGQGGVMPPEAFVFEGHRASRSQGTSGLKLGGKKGKKGGGKPNNRSTRRAKAWKASGGK
ncbi:hypothetical protein BDY21DRAFT_419664 [Lineolata rhizophorae]|uniref:Nucleolar protein 12 n=1 Tax=Lineolata rhizophorae TaxID=578093 RepID=A0A6A6P7Y6_9PEZI|nr:hypothetical protein BDY21DRAFT_419664 [Lineolata rhizophorae]